MIASVRVAAGALLSLLPLLCSDFANAGEGITIKLENQTDRERKTEQQLIRILSEYDLSRWMFTRSIAIDEKAIPHSHPVLTLSARHLKDDELLLSTFVHEQLHWFVGLHRAETTAVIRELRRLYPRIPVGFPQGSSDEDGNYEHLIVVLLEYRADQTLLGELKARAVMTFWSEDHYTWIYKEILGNPKKVEKVLEIHGLMPRLFYPTP